MFDWIDPYLDQYLGYQARHPQLTALIWAGVWLLALLLGLLLAKLFFTRLARGVADMAWAREGVRYKTWEILPADAARQRIEAAFRFLFVLLRLFLLAAYAVVVLNLFPQTERAGWAMAEALGQRLYALLLDVLLYIPSLVYIAAVVWLTAHAIRLLKAFMQQIEEQKLAFRMFPPEYAAPTRQIATFFIVVFAMVVVAPYLPGSGSNAFQAVTLFIGVLVSLGSSTAVANLIASFVLQYMRAFRVGDTVEVGAHVGRILQVDLFSTRILTLANEEVAIPNSLVLTSAMKNYSRSEHVAVRGAVSIGYDVPGTKVHAALLEAAKRDAEILADPAPFVVQKSLDDYYVSYELFAYTKEVARLPRVRSKLHETIRETFDEAGIEILSPAFTELRGKVAVGA
ncbi:MAG: mechanosensitive ion channel family protein [Planctomycetota bacterium]|nr:mechanosensitive ion channel family protein [Planctomycetota bacterium]